MTESENYRDEHPFIYSGPAINKYGDYTDPADMHICGYCGYQFAGRYVHRLSVTRNGKTREMYRCNECMKDMKDYKPSDR